MAVRTSIEYGYFNDSVGGAYAADSPQELSGTYLAAGAFTGSDDLPKDGTQFNSVNDFDVYCSDLIDKQHANSQVDTGGVKTVFDNASYYLGLGGHGSDSLEGTGSDTGEGVLYGRGGDDSLTAGAGGALLHGGSGEDTLVSGGHNDWLEGGAGSNVIRFTDFAEYKAANIAALHNADTTVDVSAVAAAHGGTSFDAVSDFNGQALEVEARVHGGWTMFLFDLDGDGHADARLIIKGGDYSNYSHFVGVTVSAGFDGSQELHQLRAHDHHALVV